MIKELILYFLFERLRFKKLLPWKCEICGHGMQQHYYEDDDLHCKKCGWCL